jgi:DNA replication and repair protein RecF
MKILKLKLNNFRQFKKKEILFKEDMTAISGPNAIGKSTIIEAIYMLSTGLSPWTSDNSAIVRNNLEKKNRIGRIEADIESDEKTKNIALVIKSNNGSTIKEYRINNKPVTKPKFTQILNTVIFSPDLIDLLMFEPRQRRIFLDSYISKVDIEYDDILQQFNKSLKQRNSLLKILSNRNNLSDTDKQNLGIWTQKIIDLGSLVTIKRIRFIEQINETLPDLYPNEIKYKPNIELSEIEELADEKYIRQSYRDQIAEKFRKEMAIGITLVGPHRDDWFLDYKGKDLNRFGSRGEKRMAIADIAFKMNQLLIDTDKDKPVILLDDIPSELDDKNISRLFNGKLLEDQQTIITTTDIDGINKNIKRDIQVIKL